MTNATTPTIAGSTNAITTTYHDCHYAYYHNQHSYFHYQLLRNYIRHNYQSWYCCDHNPTSSASADPTATTTEATTTTTAATCHCFYHHYC